MGRYRVILADPPWPHDNYRDTKHGAARAHYQPMSLDSIKALPVADLADDRAMLFLWTTAVGAAEGWHSDVMRAWGFEPKTLGFVWNKVYSSGSPYCGLGRYTRSGVELCFLGRRGKWWREDAGVYQVFTAPRADRHSQKPPTAHKRIETLLGDVPRIELFARTRRDGWDAHGLEAPGWVVALNSGKLTGTDANILETHTTERNRDGTTSMVDG